MQVRGVSLADTELQMSLAGNSIGLGIAPVGVFLPRVQGAERLMYRTAERLRKMPFRSGGRVPASIVDKMELYTSVARAASFAVFLRVGQSTQMMIEGTSSLAEETIDDMLDCLDLFNKGNQELLKKRIPQEDYYTNFVGLARSIAPDGNDVKLVGFSAVRAGAMKTVSLTGQGVREIQYGATLDLAALSAPEGDQGPTTLQGYLKEADSRDTKRGKIQVVDAQGASHTVIVAPSMMSDIVRPLWDTEVVITGEIKRRALHLADIRPAPKK
jgi:hypothetical protein